MSWGHSLSSRPVFYPHSQKNHLSCKLCLPLLTISHCLSMHLILGYESKLLSYEALHSSSVSSSMCSKPQRPTSTCLHISVWTLLECPTSASLRTCSVPQSYLTLWDPIDCSSQAPLSMGFPRQEYWSGWPFPSPGNLSDPGIEPTCPTWQADSLSLCHLGSHFTFHRSSNPFIPKCQSVNQYANPQ